MRDHVPVLIEDFNGLWARGDPEAAPPDHFADCQNVQYLQSAFRTRDGLDIYEAYPRVLRIYTYVFLSGADKNIATESLLILDDAGNIYHDRSPTPFTPILHVDGMIDFGFTPYNGRAYITPCNSVTGLQNQFVYVYKGDGTPARPAGGAPPTVAPNVAAGGAGHIEAGIHIFAVVFETDTGFLTQIGPPAQFTFSGTTTAALTNIQVSPDSFVVARRIVATKAIDPTTFDGNLQGSQFFFVPGGRIADNTTTSLTVDFYDEELLSDASHLLDIFTNIPAGVGLNTYHNRLIIFATYHDPSICYVSTAGEPEAVDQVSGLLIAPIEGNPLTNGQQFRDILYLFKKTRTYAYVDNGDVPSSWPLTIIDQGIGASVHGVSTVLDSGGVNIDYLVIIDFSGVMLFNGSYTRPELSWKIKDYWLSLDKNFFFNIQIYNDTLSQTLFITLPQQQILIGDYSNGIDPKNIRWAKWLFNILTTTITLININVLIIGSRGPNPDDPPPGVAPIPIPPPPTPNPPPPPPPPPITCVTTLSSSSASFDSTAQSGSFNIQETDPSCSWTATTTDSWVHITSAAAGTGNAVLNYNIDQNLVTSSGRVGHIQVNDKVFTIQQAAHPNPPPPPPPPPPPVCAFTLTTNSVNIDSLPQSGSFGLNASDPSCAWTASSDSTWLVITSSSSGTGSSTITWNASINAGNVPRVGNITVGGQIYRVTQAPPAAPPPPPPPDTNLYTILLTWTTDPAATSYVLQVGSAPGLFDVISGVQTQFTSYSTDLLSGTYYARVYSQPSGLVSNEWQFVV